MGSVSVCRSASLSVCHDHPTANDYHPLEAEKTDGIIDTLSLHAHAWRSIVAAILLGTSFLALSFFDGMPVNAIFFAGAVTMVLLATGLAGRAALVRTAYDNPGAVLVAGAYLVAILVNYQWTISKDMSFAGCWALAWLPLGFIVTTSLRGSQRWRLFAGISAIVLCFATASLLSFVMTGELAAPLSDPNNYATLLYLVLIVWTWRYLIADWQGDLSRLTRVAGLLAFAVLVATVQATQSRTGLVIVCVALMLFFGVSLLCRRSPRTILTLIAIAVVTYLLVGHQLSSTSGFGAVDLGSGVNARLVLNRAALAIVSEYPLTGSGINTFSLLYRLNRDPLDQESAGLYVHNDYLQLLAEGGPLLVLPLLVFAGWVAWRFFREWRTTYQARAVGDSAAAVALPDTRFGVLMALGAVLTHALVNFVLMVSVLALLTGILTALALPHERTKEAQPARRSLLWGVGAALAFAWICLAQLLLDTLSIGVYQGQAGIPFAGVVREDPARILRYSEIVESLNTNRGVPAYAQAVLHHQQLNVTPDQDLRDLTLETFRRAVRKDPWNPSVFLSMYNFVVAAQSEPESLTPNELPEQLLLRAVTLDPVFIEGYDAIVAHYHGNNQPEVAYAMVKSHLAPWLEWLTVRNPAAADRYRDYLMKMARRYADTDLLKTLESRPRTPLDPVE